MSPDDVRNTLTPQIAKLVAEVQGARQDIRNLHDAATPAKESVQCAQFAASEIRDRLDLSLNTVNRLISLVQLEAENSERRIRIPPEPHGLLWMMFIGWVAGVGCVLAVIQFL